MSDKLLEVKNLSVEYDTEISTVYAVNGLDLDLNYGETLGLVGETGAGKTTTALSVIQLLPEGIGFVTDGSIKLDGVDMLNAPEEKIRAMRGSVVSMIFQDPMSALNPVMTVGAQIMEVLKIHHPEQSTAQLEARVDEMMELVGIPAKRKVEYPHQFSGGMKQRIVIAIALACEPKLILADEPTTALDVTIQAQMLGLINELQKRLNTAMILITHDLGLWPRPAKRSWSCTPVRPSSTAQQRISLRPRSATLTPRGCSTPFPSWMRTPSVWRPLRG